VGPSNHVLHEGQDRTKPDLDPYLILGYLDHVCQIGLISEPPQAPWLL